MKFDESKFIVQVYNSLMRSIQVVVKRVKAKGVTVVVYEPTLDAPEFFGSEMCIRDRALADTTRSFI